MTRTMECEVIQRLLPHRFPFLMLDRVLELTPGKQGIGLKNVTINEPFFQGHFPERPIMPGIMIIESIAQLVAIVYCTKILAEKGIEDFYRLEDLDKLESAGLSKGEIANHVGYLAEINVKFRQIVVPGDQLEVSAIIGKSLGKLSDVKVSARVKNTIVADGKLIVSQRG